MNCKKKKTLRQEFEKHSNYSRSIWLNIFYFLILLALVLTIYICNYFIPALKTYLISITKNKISILITVDGLITTSTFAFIAFISISPNASGSSLTMNRLAWKGIWIFRYQFLLIFSVAFTMTDCFLDSSDLYFLIFIGAIFSGLILIFVIFKYVYNNKNLNSNSAKKLGYIISNPYSQKDFNKSFRNLVHPLRGTTNADFIKDVLQQFPLLDVMKNEIKSLNKIKSLLDSEFEAYKKESNPIYNLAFRKMMNVIRTNKKIPDNTKMKISVWVFMKIIRNYNQNNKNMIVDKYTEKEFKYFVSIFINDSVIIKLNKNGEINKKTSIQRYYYNLFEETNRYFVVKSDMDKKADQLFQNKNW